MKNLSEARQECITKLEELIAENQTVLAAVGAYDGEKLPKSLIVDYANGVEEVVASVKANIEKLLKEVEA